jgi:hypothetical protein
MLETLAVFGAEFLPTEIEIDGIALSVVINQLLINQTELLQTVSTQQEYIQQLQGYISITNQTVLISGANLQVVSGAGETSSLVNGTGNIIIGYNEGDNNNKSGSHNLIVGPMHSYSSFGGVVFGSMNEVSGIYSVVLGGNNNVASGLLSTVSGGMANTAIEEQSSIFGGSSNIASGWRSTVLGGQQNTASAWYSTVVGDAWNTFLDNSADGNTID